MPTPADILNYAADVVLSSPEKWTQGDYTRVADDRSGALCFCALGALQRATHDLTGYKLDEAYYAAREKLNRLVGYSVAEWNDHPDRTHAQVITALKKAAADA